MPILPTYSGVSTSIALQNTPKLPEDPAAGQLRRLGEQAVETGNEFGRVMQKRDALDAEAISMQRGLQYKKEGQEMIDSMSMKPELGRTARESFAKWDQQKRAELFKGLNPRASAALAQHIDSYAVEFQHHSMQLENRVHLEDYQGQDVAAQRDAVDTISTLSGDTDPTKDKAYTNYVKYLDLGVQNGYFKPHEAEARKQAVLIGGVTSQIMKLANTVDPKEIEEKLKQFTQEKLEPGSTPLKYLGAEKLNATERILKERQEHLINAENTKKDREYRDTKRMTEDLSEAAWTMAEMKMQDPARYGPLTHEWLDLAGETGLITKDHLKVWHDRVNHQQMGGTDTPYDNPVMVGRLWNQAFTVTDGPSAKKLQTEIMGHLAAHRLAAGPDTPAGKILAHIQPLVNSKEGGPPTNYQQMAEVKDQAKHELSISNAFSDETLKGAQDAVYAMVLKDQTDNAAEGYKLSPQEVYEKNAPRYKAILGIPAMREQTMLQNQLGIKQTRDTKESNQIIESERQRARDAFNAAEPGPGGDKQRLEALTRVENLKKLEDINKAIEKFGAEKTASRLQMLTSGGGGSASKPTEKPKAGGPVPVNKGNFK